MLNQEHLSKLFCDTNREEIHVVEAQILTISNQFLDALANDPSFGEVVVSSLRPTLKNGGLRGFFVAIRGKVGHIQDLSIRTLFWRIIDGIGFLTDATSTEWRYLTLEQRFKYLEFAKAEAFGS